MTRELDWNWLDSQATTGATRRALQEIALLRKDALAKNVLPEGGEYLLEMAGKQLVVPRRCAFQVLEVYVESFRDNDHLLLPDFRPLPGSVVMDVGANCGLYALHCLEISNCRLICCEPVPDTFALLRKNLDLNRHLFAEDIQVAVCPVALGSCRKRIKMTFSPYYPALSGEMLLKINRPWLKEEWISHTEVEQVRLGDLFAGYALSYVDILKIDVEGAELDVLKGAQDIMSRVARVVVEYHSPALRAAVVSFLQDKGFALVFEATSGSYYGDLYFIRE